MSTSTAPAGSTFTLGRDFTDAARLASFANGRLLSAADLVTDQRTLATRDRWVGQAAGAGAIDGLTVTASETAVTVAAGLGITGTGEPVVLKQAATLPLAVPLAEATAQASPATFGCCRGPDAVSSSLVAAGSYLLSVRPATRSEGSAAAAAAPGASSGGCVAAWTAAGVEFRVTALPIGTTVAGVKMTAENRRNLVAAWCFGTEQRAALAAGPFAEPEPDALQLAGVGPEDLPLAVLAWDGQSIADLDLWSVRRRVTAPRAGDDAWALVSSDRRISEGQARFRQFQDQVAELVRKQVADQATASSLFPVLPPVGFLPLGASDQKDLITAARQRLDQLALGEDELGAPAEAVPGEAAPAVPAPAEGVPAPPPAAAAPRGFQPLDDARTALTDRLPLGAVELLLIARAFAAAGGSGFRLQTFFGRNARFGGIVDFELAELALRESWYRPPLVLSNDDDEEPAGDDGEVRRLIARVAERAAGDDQQPDPRRLVRRTPPLTVYLVRENLVALASTTSSKRVRLLHQLQGLPSIAGPYVVFVSNYRWYSDTEPPAFLVRSLATLGR